jgi:copper transport protein
VTIRLAALLVLLCLFVSPGAQAHANFVDSTPAQGARLAEVPQEVSVVLSQDVDPAGSALQVVDGTGVRIDNDDLVVQSGTEPVLTVTLRPDVGEGAYQVEWKALSRVDHHTTQGSFGFAVGNFTPPPSEDLSTNAPGVPSVVGRTLFFLGLFLAAASSLFALFVARDPLGNLLREVDLIGWPLLVAGSVTLLGDAVARTGLGPAEWLDSVVLQDLIVRSLLATSMMLAAILMRPGMAARRGVLSFGVLALTFYSARSGHASSAGWAWTGLDALHLLATAAWVGGLLLFSFILLNPHRIQVADAGLMAIGRRFSRAALVAVLVMALTGVILGVGILGWPVLADPFAWFAGIYGTALLGKIVLALVMVGLAGVNRYVFLGRLLGATDSMVPVRRRFGRFVGAEAMVGVVVLVLAAILTSTSPPYASTDDAARETSGESQQFLVTMRAQPAPSPGAFSDLELRIVWKEDGSILMNDTCGRPSGCILLEVAAPGAEEHDEDETDVHHGGEHRRLEPQGDGTWLVPDVLFVGEGEYEFLVEIQTEYVFFDVVTMHLQVGDGTGEMHDEHAGHSMTPTNETAQP